MKTSFTFRSFPFRLPVTWLPIASFFLLGLSFANPALAQTIQWDKTLGGFHDDILTAMQPTSDGGYIVGGSSSSGIGGDKSEPNRENSFNSNDYSDYWIVKTDAKGQKVWDRTFGGDYYEFLSTVQQTKDGGYILAGTSHSNISGDKTENSKGQADFWVVKVDATGNKQWDKTIGGKLDDQLSSVLQTSDGGYILYGGSESNTSGDK
ncbi:hypothetical protein [Adhaeribacter pallidiroseus]|uniref:T9SS C-terminal target domain-containing protein n=1 Tax=Adhaeribacter pallidiroseus TaxID=2072847 RepID=A0A369QPV2_9BACT|nr:hypothetical protein [Adhaeribacter pallidiroseus]RDC64879.1 hypothetical protein AHMF7616_03501 [Adhaeribacter pallidiroseus]